MPRRVVSATTRQTKKVPGAPRDVRDALDRLGIGSPKTNGTMTKPLSRLSSNKPESPWVAILILFVVTHQANPDPFFQDTGLAPAALTRWSIVLD